MPVPKPCRSVLGTTRGSSVSMKTKFWLGRSVLDCQLQVAALQRSCTCLMDECGPSLTVSSIGVSYKVRQLLGPHQTAWTATKRIVTMSFNYSHAGLKSRPRASLRLPEQLHVVSWTPRTRTPLVIDNLCDHTCLAPLQGLRDRGKSKCPPKQGCLSSCDSTMLPREIVHATAETEAHRTSVSGSLGLVFSSELLDRTRRSRTTQSELML